VLGYLDASSFLRGSMILDLVAARECIQKQIAHPLEITVTEAAFGIHETVNETMAQAASIHALEKGLKASSYAMIPIGGAGPVHACHVALKLGIERLVIPMGAGVASAFGFLASPMSFQFVQASVSPVQLLDEQVVEQLIEGLKKKGLTMLAESGLAAALCTTQVSAAMRYVGQGYEVEVPVSMGRLKQSFKQHLSEEFNRCYQNLYGRIEADTPAEVVSWRVVVQGPLPNLLEQLKANLIHTQASSTSADVAIKNSREVFCVFSKDFLPTPVYDRYALKTGMRFEGPAIVEERESTVVVPKYASVVIDQHHNMLIQLVDPTAQAVD
jgi:N-methylhydantoinase A